jgi:hypothetical protein
MHFIITAYVLFLLYFVLINLLYYFTNCTYCCMYASVRNLLYYLQICAYWLYIKIVRYALCTLYHYRLAQIMRVRFSNPDSQTHVLKLRFSTPILKLRFSNLDSQTQILNLGFSKSQILKMGFSISDSQLQLLKIRCSTQILNFGFSKSQIPQNQILKIRHCLARRDRNQG